MSILSGYCSAQQAVRGTMTETILIVDDEEGIRTSLAGILEGEIQRAAGDLDAIRKGLLLGVQARKTRQQRRMNVQNLARISCNKIFAQEPHVPGEANQLDARPFENRDDLTVEIRTLNAFRIEREVS